MISYTLAALAVASSAFAAPTPTGPGPNTVVAANGECTIEWTKDTNTTVPWSTMNIEFMTGSNEQMTHMRTVATVDATSTTTFSWVCPDVDLYAPVYFYQFSSPADPTNLQWVTRFTITSTSGASVPAPETDSNGVGWGVGHFVDSSLYNAMPSYLDGNGQLQGAPGNSTTSTTAGGSSTAVSTATNSGATQTSSGATGGSTTTGIATVTKSSSTGTTSSPSTTATTSTGGASALSSSSLMTLFGALMAGAAAFSL